MPQRPSRLMTTLRYCSSPRSRGAPALQAGHFSFSRARRPCATAPPRSSTGFLFEVWLGLVIAPALFDRQAQSLRAGTEAKKMDVIVDCGDLCGEGPIWDVERQQLYWTDCVGLKFYRYDWRTQRHEQLKDGLEINGFALNHDGGFVVSNNSGIWLWDEGSGVALVADFVDGAKCQMNDCVADPVGRLLAGSWFYEPSKDYPLGKLISIDNPGKGAILDEGIHLANGLGFSPDTRTLYFTDSAQRIIYAYDYKPVTGSVGNRRVFVQVPTTEGLPDVLTVDVEGFVWSAQWYGCCVVRYDPDGKVERQIPTPAKQTSSLAFGGPDLADIFVTSAGRSESMPVMPPGYDPITGYFGGALYHMNLGIRGKPEFHACIHLRK
jgi:sugar lactone lactonase YvrE